MKLVPKVVKGCHYSELFMSTIFSIPADSDEQVELSDLIGSLNKSSEHGNLKKKLVSKSVLGAC